MVKDNCFKSKKLGEIRYEEIISYRKLTVRGSTVFIVKFHERKKMAIGPYGNFSIKADKIFMEFINEFEAKMEWFKLTREKQNKLQLVEGENE